MVNLLGLIQQIKHRQLITATHLIMEILMNRPTTSNPERVRFEKWVTGTSVWRDGKLREAARLLSHKTFEHHALKMAEDMAYKLMTKRFSDMYREGQH